MKETPATPIPLWTLIATAAWLGEALLTGMLQVRARSAAGMPADTTAVMVDNALGSGLWIVPTVLALVLTRRWPLGRPVRPVAVLVHLGGLASAIVLRAVGVFLLNDVGGWYPVRPPFSTVLVDSSANNWLFYLLLLAGAHALHYARAHRVNQRELAAARLRELRGQLRPHFLFNTLNTIAALIPDEPQQAERMVVQLSTLLRHSLATDDTVEVPLEQELGVAEAYLAIEQVRFSDRMSVQITAGPEVQRAMVPPFLLQPLVENAVRHGLAPRPGPGSVRVTATRDGDVLDLAVEDDGVGIRRGANASGGVGLANTRARLASLYGPHHRFSVDDRGGGGVRAHVRLPWRTAPV